MSTTNPSPLGAIARGIAAGVVGTGVMTLAQTLPSKLQSSGGGDGGSQDEGEQQQQTWDEASAPAKVAKKVSEGVFDHEVSPKRIPLLTQGMHWGYGTAWGGVYGLLQGSVHAPPLRHGLLFGTVVWAMSYVQLVPMGLYEPPWKYAPKDIAMEIGYHLAYGAGVAGAFRVLDGR
jgi:uncharacterized membrane protein YagU involved in acid resistance